MKKSLLALGFLALSSTQLFGLTACVSGSLATFNATPCTVTNGTNSWDLFSNGFTAPGTFSNYSTSTLTASEIQVTFNLWNNGFSINYSPIGADAIAKFGANFAANNTQNAGFETGFILTPNNAASKITVIGTDLDGPTGTIPVRVDGTSSQTGSLPNADLIKYAFRNGTGLFQTFSRNTTAIPNSSNLFTPVLGSDLSNPLTTTLAIVDKFTANGGTNVGGSITTFGYTNYFAPAAVQTGVPEPMSFALMGAGLVGLAILRRRK